MRPGILFLTLALAAVTAPLLSCSDDETTNPPQNTEFIAKDADVAGYASWTKVAGPLQGPDPAGLLNGGAHMGNNADASRIIFINNAAAVRGSNGEFPNGTILVKELRAKDGTVAVITAMAKRGGTFNTAHKGWEWLILDPSSRAIQTRADTLMGGVCNGCHSAKASADYVFTK